MILFTGRISKDSSFESSSGDECVIIYEEAGGKAWARIGNDQWRVRPAYKEGRTEENELPLKKRRAFTKTIMMPPRQPPPMLVKCSENKYSPPQRRMEYQGTNSRGYTLKLSLLGDIFKAESMIREIAIEVEKRSHIMADLGTLVANNKRVDRMRVPPCTFFNLNGCEFKGVLSHTTRGDPRAKNERPVKKILVRSHTCAVCYGQGLVSPHRAANCPILRALDAEMEMECKREHE